MHRRRVLVIAIVLSAFAVPAIALGHIERAAYWPDPAPDKAVTPAAGGDVPSVRTLTSSLSKRRATASSPRGRTRVVCSNRSLRLLRASIKKARKSGYDLRPTDHRKLSKRAAARLLKLNKRLFKRCRFKEIQPAVNASRNNDRVVVMPGLYTEPTARKAPTQDPACADLRLANDRSSGALSYAYQVKCPHDQNLIAVLGREVGPGSDPQPPLEERRGIPNLGPCVRCNLQLEGSGVSPDDVIVEVGKAEAGDKGPIAFAKDVGIRVDRADGFVLRNVKVRHAGEHAIYVLETDGFVLDRTKTFYAGSYGILTFVEDHGLISNCEAAGHGDSGVYPGAAAETGEQRVATETARYNQEIRNCDSHHNASGYSGTAANAVWVHDNNFYDNALGFTTDVFTAAGHPGFPQDSDLVEDNNFYDNNFNPYASGSDVVPTVPLPVGTGLWIAGGNANIVRRNRFWNNWRRGVMLFAVPDAFVCGPAADGNQQAGCDPQKISTSHRNRFYENVMGVDLDGKSAPNGTDFWWDSFAGNQANCWYDNKPAEGTQISTSPASLPSCNGGRNPEQSVGTGAALNEAELLNCLGDVEFQTGTCPWFDTPPKPGR